MNATALEGNWDFRDVGDNCSLKKPPPASEALRKRTVEALICPDVPSGVLTEHLVKVAKDIEGLNVHESDANKGRVILSRKVQPTTTDWLVVIMQIGVSHTMQRVLAIQFLLPEGTNKKQLTTEEDILGDKLVQELEIGLYHNCILLRSLVSSVNASNRKPQWKSSAALIDNAESSPLWEHDPKLTRQQIKKMKQKSAFNPFAALAETKSTAVQLHETYWQLLRGMYLDSKIKELKEEGAEMEVHARNKEYRLAQLMSALQPV